MNRDNPAVLRTARTVAYTTQSAISIDATPRLHKNTFKVFGNVSYKAANEHGDI